MNAAAPQSHRFSAGVLAVLVHVVFLAMLIFGLSWQAKEPPAMVVDLWSKLPGDTPPPPPVGATPKPIPPIKKVEPPPPPPTLKAKPDIALKEKLKPEKPKPVEKIKPPEKIPKKIPKKIIETPPVQPEPLKIQKQLEQKRLEQIRQAANRQAEITRELVAQAEAAQTRAEMARQAQAKQNAAMQSVIDDYKNRIKARIRSKLNRSVCGDGNPQVEFTIGLLPTGELRGSPILRRGSGLTACDKAVADAIQNSEPLPVPPQPEIFGEFRNLDLIFKPNE